MDENMDNLFANMKKMIDNGNITGVWHFWKFKIDVSI